MAKGLLINPSYFPTYGASDGGLLAPVFPVLSIASLGGAMKARGHDLRILDLSYRPYDGDVVERCIRDTRPDVIGITATTPLVNQVRDISFLVKDLFPEITTIAGGPHASALPRETLRSSALDLVCAGEGDWVMADLLDGRDPAAIPGVHRRCGDDVVATARAPLLENLDDLPMPAWDDYPLEGNRYVTRMLARQRPVTTIEFSRGCIYRCDFCASKNTLGRGYRKKSPERCAEELERLARLGFREVVLTDDIFTSDNEWAAAVCEAMLRRPTGISWACSNGIRVDSANPELFRLMRRAGCYRVFFGFESGNDAVLRAFGKGGQASLQQGIEAVALAREAGLEADGFFMVGLSGDTEDTMQDTIDYARTLELDTMKCGICVPFPGTAMFDDLHRHGRIKTLDWDQYTVYNHAEKVYDHPTLDWSQIRRYFKKFYSEACLRNPAFLRRRLRHALRNREVLWTAQYALRFLKTVFRSPRRSRDVEYRYESSWRPLDLRIDEPLSAPDPPRAARAVVTVRRRPAARP